MSTAQQFDVCSKCGTAPQDGAQLQRCSRCKLTFYCGADCQNTAWKTHKRVCKAPPACTLKLTEPGSAVKATRLLGGHNRPFYPVATIVPASHPVWTTGAISPLSQIVGLPLLIHRELEEVPVNVRNDADKDNQAVTYLMIDPETGYAPPRWQKNIGPVTIVRADHKPLTPVAFEMIWMFCDRVLDRFGDGPEFAMRLYKKEEFNKFCEQYKEDYANSVRADEIDAQELPL
ncbi:hypothetical protein BC835DRAFT_1411127 [Cytidiella melzeri]|nr:hypothetical protein BC835DRAFT_1411127 [Cytidiella melzeri]